MHHHKMFTNNRFKGNVPILDSNRKLQKLKILSIASLRGVVRRGGTYSKIHKIYSHTFVIFSLVTIATSTIYIILLVCY